MTDRFARHWLVLLVVVLGCLDAFLGTNERGLTAVLGVVGGVAIIAFAVSAARIAPRASVALLLLATIPFAGLTWWSLVTPFIALLVLVLGVALVLRPHRLAST